VSEWICVKDRQPNAGSEVIYFDGYHVKHGFALKVTYPKVGKAEVIIHKNVGGSGPDSYPAQALATHWQYLPEPPK